MAFFYWDPSPYVCALRIPLIGRPILWYGLFFSTGFFLGYWRLLKALRESFSQKEAKRLTEKLTLYVVVGTVVGARLGDLLFYQSVRSLLDHPISAFQVWEGGLSSHGGVVGILVALFLFSRRERALSWLSLLDLVALVAGLVAGSIRIGNFFNQELIGVKTRVPWGVVFGHPADRSLPEPRHPVQLYEAFFYFALFFFLWELWRKAPKIHLRGRMSGLFLLLVFTFRFFIEFFKEEASIYLSPHAFLDMAQWLSLPFILLGVFLLVRKEKKSYKVSACTPCC